MPTCKVHELHVLKREVFLFILVLYRVHVDEGRARKYARPRSLRTCPERYHAHPPRSLSQSLRRPLPGPSSHIFEKQKLGDPSWSLLPSCSMVFWTSVMVTFAMTLASGFGGVWLSESVSPSCGGVPAIRITAATKER